MTKNEVINCVREHLDKWYASNNHNETAIQLVNEYEERVRADGRRKFAEYMKNVAHIDVSEYLYEYEKEIEND